MSGVLSVLIGSGSGQSVVAPFATLDPSFRISSGVADSHTFANPAINTNVASITAYEWNFTGSIGGGGSWLLANKFTANPTISVGGVAVGQTVTYAVNVLLNGSLLSSNCTLSYTRIS